jgi:hypothetical protein
VTFEEARRNVRLEGLAMVLEGIARGKRAAAQGRTVTRPRFESPRVTATATKPQELAPATAPDRAA